jgi:hypothetical protein
MDDAPAAAAIADEAAVELISELAFELAINEAASALCS